MKKKILALFLAAAMVLSMSVTVFAETADIIDGDSIESVEEGSNAVTIDVTATDSSTPTLPTSYVVQVSWKITPAATTGTDGYGYEWNSVGGYYDVKGDAGESNNDTTTTPAQVMITVKNLSNADVNYAITYASVKDDEEKPVSVATETDSGYENAIENSVASGTILTFVDGDNTKDAKAKEEPESITYYAKVGYADGKDFKSTGESHKMGTFTVAITAATA